MIMDEEMVIKAQKSSNFVRELFWECLTIMNHKNWISLEKFLSLIH